MLAAVNSQNFFFVLIFFSHIISTLSVFLKSTAAICEKTLKIYQGKYRFFKTIPQKVDICEKMRFYPLLSAFLQFVYIERRFWVFYTFSKC